MGMVEATCEWANANRWGVETLLGLFFLTPLHGSLPQDRHGTPVSE